MSDHIADATKSSRVASLRYGLFGAGLMAPITPFGSVAVLAVIGVAITGLLTGGTTATPSAAEVSAEVSSPIGSDSIAAAKQSEIAREEAEQSAAALSPSPKSNATAPPQDTQPPRVSSLVQTNQGPLPNTAFANQSEWQGPDPSNPDHWLLVFSGLDQRKTPATPAVLVYEMPTDPNTDTYGVNEVGEYLPSNGSELTHDTLSITSATTDSVSLQAVNQHGADVNVVPLTFDLRSLSFVK